MKARGLQRLLWKWFVSRSVGLKSAVGCLRQHPMYADRAYEVIEAFSDTNLVAALGTHLKSICSSTVEHLALCHDLLPFVAASDRISSPDGDGAQARQLVAYLADAGLRAAEVSDVRRPPVLCCALLLPCLTRFVGCTTVDCGGGLRRACHAGRSVGLLH